MNAAQQTIRVYCVDDNPLVIEALQLQLQNNGDIEYMGSSSSADDFLENVRGNCPDIVLLDIDMPGKDPFEAIEDLPQICSKARVIMYSGLIHRDLLDRALDAGAWGYVAKVDGEVALLTAIRETVAGSMGFSPSIQSLYS